MSQCRVALPRGPVASPPSGSLYRVASGNTYAAPPLTITSTIGDVIHLPGLVWDAGTDWRAAERQRGPLGRSWRVCELWGAADTMTARCGGCNCEPHSHACCTSKCICAQDIGIPYTNPHCPGPRLCRVSGEQHSVQRPHL